jgi:hypothetical protein
LELLVFSPGQVALPSAADGGALPPLLVAMVWLFRGTSRELEPGQVDGHDPWVSIL